MNIFLRFPEGRSQALTLSYDDGVYQDIRLMKTITPHGLKCTFNINTGCFGEKDADDIAKGRLSRSQVLALYKDSGHEVAVHGKTHPFLDQMPPAMATAEVLDDRKEIENMFGTVVRGMAYPYGTYNDDLVGILKNCGIVYSRTTRSTGNFAIPTDWLRLPATCHHSDSRLPELCDKFLENDRHGKPKLFYLWGHSYEFDRIGQDGRDCWHIIEDFAEKMGNRPQIWYATNIEIYDYWNAYRQLIFNAACTRVFNPSSMPVWFFANGTVYRVNSGETLAL